MHNALVQQIHDCKPMRRFVLANSRVKWLEGLVKRVSKAVPATAGSDPVKLRIAVAMLALGPPYAGIPPAAMRDKVRKILIRHVRVDRERRVEEFVIVYGCGRWRKPLGGVGTTWDHKWGNAQLQLGRMFFKFVHVAAAWLHQYVPNYPAPTFKISSEHSDDLALRFVNPVKVRGAVAGPVSMRIDADPRGAVRPGATVTLNGSVSFYKPGMKAVFSVDARTTFVHGSRVFRPRYTTKVLISVLNDETLVRTSAGRRFHLTQGEPLLIESPSPIEEYQCPCGSTHCKKGHRLENCPAHDPRIELDSYVASAVKGPPARGRRVRKEAAPSTGGFVGGMYYWKLAFETSAPWPLLLVTVEYTVCAKCGLEFQPGVPPQCPGCATPVDRGSARRISRDRLLLMNGPIRYRREARLRCAATAKHFAKAPLLTPPMEEFLKTKLGDDWREIMGPDWRIRTVEEWDALQGEDWHEKLGEYWHNLYGAPPTFMKWYEARRILRDPGAWPELASLRGETVDDFLASLRQAMRPFEYWLECARLSQNRESWPDQAALARVSVPEFEKKLEVDMADFRRQCGCPICGSVPTAKSRPTYVWVG
jgi:hypothetical protein